MPEDLTQKMTLIPPDVSTAKSRIASVFSLLREKADESEGVLGSVASRITNIGSVAKTAIAGTAVTAVLGLVSAMTKAAATAIRFEENLQKVATLIEGDVEGSLDRFAEGIDRIRRDLPVTTDLTRALYDAISAGVDEDNALSFLREAAKAGVAGATDTKTAVDALTSALNAYGKNVREAEEVSDSFFTTVEAGKTTFPEMADQMGDVLPIASSLGIELDEVNAALAALTKQGLATPKAATGLRSLFNQLIQRQEEFRQAGIDVQKVIGERGLLGLLRELRDETGGNAKATRRFIRDVEGLNAALALSGEGLADFADVMQQMANKSGATEEAVRNVEGSISNLWQVTKNQLSTVMRELGEDVLPTLNTVLRTTNQLLGDAASTDLERLLSQIEGMEGIDPVIEARLRAVIDTRQAEERLQEVENRLDREIAVGVDFSDRPADFISKPLQELTIEGMEKHLEAVNEALQERARRIAELEKQGREIPEGAKRRRILLEQSREELLKGIEILSQYEAAQAAVRESQKRLNKVIEAPRRRPSTGRPIEQMWILKSGSRPGRSW